MTKELKEANAHADRSAMPEAKAVSKLAPSLPKPLLRQKKSLPKQKKQPHRLRFYNKVCAPWIISLWGVFLSACTAMQAQKNNRLTPSQPVEFPIFGGGGGKDSTPYIIMLYKNVISKKDLSFVSPADPFHEHSNTSDKNL